jgi:hypothetical protein
MKTAYKILFFAGLLLAGALFFFANKMRSASENSKIVVVDSSGAPYSVAQSIEVAKVSDDARLNEINPIALSHRPVKSLTIPNCKEQPEYRSMRTLLGTVVNKTLERRQNIKAFAKKIDNFREKSGLPIPLGLSAKNLARMGIVFDNCKTICHGNVNQVFVSRLIRGAEIEVLLKNGDLKTFRLHDSGLEIATIDQLNNRGVPFRSWRAPMSDGPWFIRDATLYYKLDVEGLSLGITSGKSSWKVVVTPKNLDELKPVEPEKILGCNTHDQCLQTDAKSGHGPRYFKAPHVCGPAVANASP